MADEAVLTEADDGVLLITLNRPDARNAVNAALANGIAAALDRLDDDDDLQVGILTGAGKGFSRRHGPEGVRGRRELVRRAPRLRRHRPGPADQAAHRGDRGLRGRRRLRDRARLRPDRRRARAPASASPRSSARSSPRAARCCACRAASPTTWRWSWRSPATRSPPSAAPSYGLVNRLTEPGEAVAAARELAAQIAANGPLALAATKRILVEAPGWAEDELWQKQAEISGPVFGSEDAREGATAFAEKRDPVWKGR